MSNNRPTGFGGNPPRGTPTGNAGGAQASSGTAQQGQAFSSTQSQATSRQTQSNTQSSSFFSNSTSQQTSQTTTSTSFSSTTQNLNESHTREYAERRLSDFSLRDNILNMMFTTDSGEKVEKSVDLDEHLGFANDNTLSWEANKFSEAVKLGASITIRNSTISAVYNSVDSAVDLFEKLRIFDGTIIMLSFAKKMYTQVPWMNFRILAVPTFNEEMERMLTLSSAKIASSTVSAASTKLMEEITKVIKTTMETVQSEIMRRVQMEVVSLKIAMEEEVRETVRATNRDKLLPIGWSTLESEYKLSAPAKPV